MQAIVAVDQGWGIGKDGGMLYEIPEDLKYFARQTRGQTVVMGRATLLSLPNAAPLGGRDNIVLTRDPAFAASGVRVAHSLEELAGLLQGKAQEEVWVIGGQDVYAQLIDYCSRAHVTRIAHAKPADRFFPDLDQRPGWRLQECGETLYAGEVAYRHCVYVNQHPLPLPRR